MPWLTATTPDERFTLHPLTGQQVLRRLRDADDEDGDEGECKPEPAEDEDS